MNYPEANSTLRSDGMAITVLTGQCQDRIRDIELVIDSRGSLTRPRRWKLNEGEFTIAHFLCPAPPRALLRMRREAIRCLKKRYGRVALRRQDDYGATGYKFIYHVKPAAR